MKQITIYDLIPLLEPGYVAMDEDGTWVWYKANPKKGVCRWCPSVDYEYDIIELGYGFKKLAPFDGDWKDSLIKVEHKEEGMTKRYTWHDFYKWSIERNCDDCGWEEDKRPCEDVMYVRFGNALFYKDGEVRINIEKLNIEKMKKIVEVLYDKDTN